MRLYTWHCFISGSSSVHFFQAPLSQWPAKFQAGVLPAPNLLRKARSTILYFPLLHAVTKSPSRPSWPQYTAIPPLSGREEEMVKRDKRSMMEASLWEAIAFSYGFLVWVKTNWTNLFIVAKPCPNKWYQWAQSYFS